MSTAGTLFNKKTSGFVRTPPPFAVRIGKYILALPLDEEFTVFDPTCGEGDFFYACAHTAKARYLGSEISSERIAIARQRWPHASLVTSAVEAVSLQGGQIDLALVNAPYFFQNGKRAPYRIGADAGEWLRPGGVRVDIITARSDFDLRMINHWLTWYDLVRVWKFPDRASAADETAFEDYTQIVVVGIRRKTPAVPTEAERKRLVGYQWKEPQKPGQSGWRYGVAPPDLPDAPLPDPYPVPTSRAVPRLVVRNADEATLLYALDKSGAHLSPSFGQATSWPEEGYLGPPAMPYTGDAHIAAEIMIGGLDGEVVRGPGSEPEAQPHIFTAFIGKEWVPMPIEDELVEKLREDGCVRVEMRQLQDKPILGVLNLATGRSRYYQGEEVFEYLSPWIPTLASRVIEKRKPLYRLDPADWEIRVLSQFGMDKRLPRAEYAGLAVPQMHRVFAMCRSLDVKGRSAIQGEPGTGKTRMAAASAKRQAYLWRHRAGEFAQHVQPAWMRGLRRTWLHTPQTLDILGLEPVYGRRIRGDRGGKGQIVRDGEARQIVAYRERATGRLLAPEEAGPKALPVLITTPLKVTREYGKEVLAAFPQAEVVHIESHRDIAHWLSRCATSSAPVVFGIFSHSLTRAFGREWKEVVREKKRKTDKPVLDPPEALLPQLEPVRERGGRGKIVGYRFKEGGKLLTKEVTVSHFFCPECGGLIVAVPGKNDPSDGAAQAKKGSGGKADKAREKDDGAESKLPVTSRTWFISKQRWCECRSRRNQERREQGRPLLRVPLWQDDRTEATNRKHPQASFRGWRAAMSQLSREAERLDRTVSTRELCERVRRDDSLLAHLVDAAFQDGRAQGLVLELVERVDNSVVALRRASGESRLALGSLLVKTALHDQELLETLVRGVIDDQEGFDHLAEVACHASTSSAAQLTESRVSLRSALDVLEKRIAEIALEEAAPLERVLRETLRVLWRDAERFSPFVQDMAQVEPDWAATIDQLYRDGNWRQLSPLLLRLALRHDATCAHLVREGLRDGSLAAALIGQAQEYDPTIEHCLLAVAREKERLLSLVVAVALEDAMVASQLVAELLLPEDDLACLLVDLARRDLASLKAVVPGVVACEQEVTRLAFVLTEREREIASHIQLSARRDSSNSVLSRLVEVTRPSVNWHAILFRSVFEQAHISTTPSATRSKRGGQLGAALDGRHAPAPWVRLCEAASGPILVEEPDLAAARGFDEVRDGLGPVFAYRRGQRVLLPIYGRWSRRIVAYVDGQTGAAVMRKSYYDFRTPPADSFSPYDYLMRFFHGCVALSVVDESHNGRGRSTDIAQSHHFAMLAAQTRELTSGTHYGGDILGFYHYWFRYNPQFWLSRGYGWDDGEKALADYGVIQEWTKEYESDARRGSGQTDIYVSTIPAAGLSANLIPGLLEDLTYLTVLDVGAHMPPKQEIPRSISMKDPQLTEAVKEAEAAALQARQAVEALARERKEIMDTGEAGTEREARLAELAERERPAKAALAAANERLSGVRTWAAQRDLAGTYSSIVKELEETARSGNAAARLALGTIPRLYSALPCDSPFRVYSTPRGDWGDKGEPELVIETPVLAWDHLYPIERWFQEVTRDERREGRRVMFYIEQVTRSMARRLEWVLKEYHPWTLPANTEAEDRQKAILDAVAAGHNVVLVPYLKVNEGLNLQTAIDTIVWAEMPKNLFLWIQASQRAWRLGKENLVKIYIPYYLGSAAHKKVRSLGERNGAAAAFAGEPAKGGLVQHVGADRTTLARLSAQIELGELSGVDLMQTLTETEGDDSAAIEANFARRNEELVEALRRGRQWFGVVDQLSERLGAVIAAQHPSVWRDLQPVTYLPEATLAALPRPNREKVGADQEGARRAAEAQNEPAPGAAHVAASPEKVEPVQAMAAQAETLVVVVFGSEEDIKRARARRGSRPRRTLPKPANPVVVKSIPAVVEVPAEAGTQQDAPLLLSIWDLAG